MILVWKMSLAVNSEADVTFSKSWMEKERMKRGNEEEKRTNGVCQNLLQILTSVLRSDTDQHSSEAKPQLRREKEGGKKR